MPSVIETYPLPIKRPFSWRALWILVGLQLLGNLLSIPTLKATGQPIDPLPVWILWTVISIPIIALSLFLGGRIGLGAPLLEGFLYGQERKEWAKTVIALSIFVAVAASPLILLVNRQVDSEGYPAIWKLLLASVDAGVQEEIFNRFFLMTILAWLGSLIWREANGRPTNTVLWIAILVTGFIFGWAHVEDKLVIPDVPFIDYLILMVVGTVYGVVFGWLYWKLGIEGAILAHFAIDVMASVIIVPTYLSQNAFLQIIALLGIILAGFSAWLVLRKIQAEKSKIAP